MTLGDLVTPVRGLHALWPHAVNVGNSDVSIGWVPEGTLTIVIEVEREVGMARVLVAYGCVGWLGTDVLRRVG